MEKTATQITVLYNIDALKVVGVLEVGNKYAIPDNVKEYFGTIEDFLNENPDYSYENED